MSNSFPFSSGGPPDDAVQLGAELKATVPEAPRCALRELTRLLARQAAAEAFPTDNTYENQKDLLTTVRRAAPPRRRSS